VTSKKHHSNNTKQKYRGIVAVAIAATIAAAFIWLPRNSGCTPPYQSTLEQTEPTKTYPADRYVGLTNTEAQTEAAQAGLEYRVVEADGKPLLITSDLYIHRVNVSLTAGKVVKAEFY
jgi:hypothetical protein